MDALLLRPMYVSAAVMELLLCQLALIVGETGISRGLAACCYVPVMSTQAQVLLTYSLAEDEVALTWMKQG